jgi:membrane-associated phospholipid phosphatase
MKRVATHIKPFTSYNPFFLIPFAIWIILGGICLLVFDKQQLFSLFNVHHSAWADVLMERTTLLGEGFFSTIVLLVLLGVKEFRNWWYFSSALLTNIVTVVVIQTVKYTVDAPRPLKYFNDAAWIHTSPEWPRLLEHSFPSGHTCAAFCLFTFLAMLLPLKYRYLGIVLFIAALAVGYSRMYLAAHFFLDVYVGSIIGGIFTIGVMIFMNSISDRFFTDTLPDATDN